MAMLNNQRVTFSLKIAMGVRLSARIPHACVIPWGFSGAIRLSGCALLPAGRVRPSVPAAVYLFCLLLVDFPCNSTSSTRARSILSFGYHLGWILLLLLAGDFFPALQLACFFSLALQWPTLFSGSTVTYTGQFWYSYLWIAIYKFLDSGGRKEDQLFCGTELDNPWCFQFAISSQFMCSFLLLFLILIVGFDFLQNSITKFHPEEALSKATCACPSYLAFALQESEGSWTGGTAPTVLDICWSSFKGPYLSQKDSSRDQEAAKDNGARALSLALYDLSAHQQKDCREVCHLFSTLVDWHTSWDGTQDTSSNSISRCLAAKRAAICLGRLGVSRSIMELASNSKEVAKPLNQLPFGKGVSESKRTQRKRCREACSQRQTQEQGHHLQCRECRRIRRHELQQFTICPADLKFTAMAITRGGFTESDAFNCDGFQSQHYRTACTEKRMCCCAQSSISGCKRCAGRNQRAHRKDGQRHREVGDGEQQIRHQEYPLSNYIARQGAKNTERDDGSEESPSQSVDQTHHGSSNNMASSVTGIPKAAGSFSRSCHQSEIRHRISKISHSDSVGQGIASNSRCNATYHDGDIRAGGRQCRSRFRGEEATRAASDSSPELRSGIAGGKSRPRKGCGRPYNGRSGARQKAPTPTFHATVWWIWVYWGNILNDGGAELVRSHGTHDATLLAGLVEAYTPVPTVYAACQPQLTNFDHNQFLHWQHSIQTEFNYLNPFDAVMSAWKLGWSVLCDTTEIHYCAKFD